MAEITEYKSVTITDLMNRLDLYKHNPSAIQGVVFNYLEEITNGEVDIVDPTSPFVFLLESSAVNTALAINENLVGLRKQYTSLAQTELELYHHLSDKDYLERFATPSSVTFTVVMQVNDVLNKMVRSVSENCFKATFPRDTRFTIDQNVFTLQYPVDIRKYDNGVVKITYNTDILSPLETLSSNVIDYVVRADSNAVEWLFFDLKLDQFIVESNVYPLQKSIAFKQSIPHNDQFYYIRSFYRNSSTNNEWVEMHTTHSDQVFDPLKPTSLIQVFDNFIQVSIPPVYLNSNIISGDVRYDLYTTKGKMTLNLANYLPDAFTVSPIAINEVRDLNEFTTVLGTLSYYTFSTDYITGGSNGIDFLTLRDRVINNATGSENVPITNKRIEAFVGSKGFELVKNVDTVTNRIFLATQKLPKPLKVKLATSANIGISTFITDLNLLKSLSTVKYIGNRVTVLSNNLYRNNNGVISILNENEVAALRTMSKSALVNHVNTHSYLYTPFYYVLDDDSDEFSVRVYNLDYPAASNLSFISQNQTLQLPVNTGSFNLSKTANGFKLTLITKSGNFYKQLTDAQVTAQIAYYPVGEIRLAYINGTLVSKTSADERVYEFELITNYDINQEDNLCIMNAKMFGNETVNTWLNLETEFHVFYNTSSIVDGFLADSSDSLLGKFILPVNSVVSTHETLVLSVGTSLKNLWSSCRSMAAGEDYQTYNNDIPLFYEQDVYDVNPTTGKTFTFDVDGKIVYNITHRAGDPALDVNGNQIYKYRKGDTVLDSNGVPVVINTPSIKKEYDMLFVDGRHKFVDDAAFLSYNDELVAVVDTWVNEDLEDIQDVLLEQTRIYFYPKSTLGAVLVYIEDGGQDLLISEQSLIVDLYVKVDIYDNVNIRTQLETSTVNELDTFIDDTVVNMTIIEESLKKVYGNSVQSFAVRGLGGSKNYRLVNLASAEKRLALKKILYQQQDGSLIIKEDVTINFLKVI